MRPPRLRCTLFPLIYPPHLLGSYKRQLYGFVLFSRLTKRNLASYVISVRRTKSSLTASFRFYLTIDTLAVQLYTSLSPRRVRDFHPLERAHGAQTKNTPFTGCPVKGVHITCKGVFFCYFIGRQPYSEGILSRAVHGVTFSFALDFLGLTTFLRQILGKIYLSDFLTTPHLFYY